MNAAEIRAHMRRLKSEQQKSPEQAVRPYAYAEKNLTNPRVVAAWLHSEPGQSGLGNEEFNSLRTKVRHIVSPEATELIQTMGEALGDVHNGNTGLRTARNLIMERTGLVLHSDGVVRAIGEPQPPIRSVMQQAAE